MSVKLLYGEETYLKEARLKKIKKEFGNLVNGINFIQIDENNVKEIISDIETPAFGYEKKLIIAKNTGLFKKEKKTAKGPEAELIKFSNKIAEYINENRDLIPNLLNQIMTVIDETVQITSISNPTGKHIVIEAQSPIYPGLGYFKRKLQINGILNNVVSGSGMKKGDFVTVTIEGDLP